MSGARGAAAEQFLAEAARGLALSLDYEATIAGLAQLAVPTFADWCFVDLITEDGQSFDRVAIGHHRPNGAQIAAALKRRYPLLPNPPPSVSRAVQEQRSELLRDIPAEFGKTVARDAEELNMIQQLSMRSAVISPLLARGRSIGALSLIVCDRNFDDSDVWFVTQLAHSAAAAIDNARLFESERAARIRVSSLLESERALRHEVETTHERMRLLFQQAPMSIAIYRGLEHRIEFANPTFLQVRSRGVDIIGKTYAEVFPEARGTGESALERAFATGEPLTFPELSSLIDRGNGPEEAFFHVSLAALKDEQGQVESVMSVSFEVTDRVLARRALDAERAKLQTVFNQAPFPIGAFEGPEHRITVANSKWEALVGRRLLVGTRLEDAVPELRAQGVLGMHDRAFAGETVIGQDIPLQLLVEGVPQSHFFHVVMHPLYSDTGSIQGHVTMALDVSDQVRARSEIDAARREAEGANRAKDDFLAMLGHELRNPLAPIMTALNLMDLRGVAGAERERSVITRQVQHLTRLVDDLLDVSRIIHGKIELTKQPIELAELVARALETASPLFEQRNQYVHVSVPRTGLLLDADPSRMTQALSNLFTNAAKYTDPGGHISVTSNVSNSEILLQIQDDGVGIRQDMLAQIFELFVQEQQGIDRARGGLGLGLAIVRSVITLHGGSVTADSPGVGKGSVFSVRLPRALRAAEPAQPTRIATTDPAPQPSPKHVLVVDDNEDAAEMLAITLRAAGHTTRQAFDGPTALRILESFEADVALLDLGLPAMDGYELAALIGAAHPTVRLIALTGYGQESDRERTRAAGFHEHLVKPADLERVLRAVAGPRPTAR